MSPAKSKRRPPPPCPAVKVLFIGAGRAAQGLAIAFAGAGITVTGLWSRGKRKVPGFATLTGPMSKAAAGADFIVLAVPDGAIAGTAKDNVGIAHVSISRLDAATSIHHCIQLVVRFNVDRRDPDYAPAQTPQLMFYSLARY